MSLKVQEPDFEALTIGGGLRLEDLIDRDALAELGRSFQALFGISLRIFARDGALLADAAGEQPICKYVGTTRQGGAACMKTVDAAKRVEPGRAGEVSYPCFTGALYRIFAITYEGRTLGKAVLGPYLPAEALEVPASLLAVDPAIDPQIARELLPRMPRATSATVSLICEHLRRSLDLILFSGHKSLLTSQMHLASIRESYRELQEKNLELQQAFDRLREVDRLKSNFLGTVSHELRTPLTSIIGYSEMLAEGLAGPLVGDQVEFVETIRQKGEQLLSLIVSLLDLSKLESGTMSLRTAPTQIAFILDEIVTTFTPAARKRSIHLSSEVRDALPLIDADPERLRQIFTNLTDNALKFSPEGGSVRLVAGLAIVSFPPEGTSEPPVLASRQVIEIRVIDEGIGIPEGERLRIFDAFYQVDSSSTREYGGTGLGLAIVKRLVEAHRGTVHVESSGAPGSVFVVRLPVLRGR